MGQGWAHMGKFPPWSSPLKNHLRVRDGTSELLTGDIPCLSVWQQKYGCCAEAQKPGTIKTEIQYKHSNKSKRVQSTQTMLGQEVFRSSITIDTLEPGTFFYSFDKYPLSLPPCARGCGSLGGTKVSDSHCSCSQGISACGNLCSTPS